MLMKRFFNEKKKLMRFARMASPDLIISKLIFRSSIMILNLWDIFVLNGIYNNFLAILIGGHSNCLPQYSQVFHLMPCASSTLVYHGAIGQSCNKRSLHMKFYCQNNPLWLWEHSIKRSETCHRRLVKKKCFGCGSTKNI